MRYCIDCNNEKPEDEFYRNKNMADGRLNSCKDCRRNACRVYSKDDARHYEMVSESRRKWPEKHNARNAVYRAIRRGELPRANTLQCKDCGGQAAHYDHAFGYERKLDVEPVCAVCHGLRSRIRGEHAT